MRIVDSPKWFGPRAFRVWVMAAVLLAVGLASAVHGGTVIYVKPVPSGLADGSSWANACSLQAALTAAVATDQVWVAAGTHKPTADADRTKSFAMKTGVAVYGGFGGTETQLAQRDTAANRTVLTGDIGAADTDTDADGISDTPGGDSADNSYHVVTISGPVTDARLDGFIVAGGRADAGTAPDGDGGGIYATGAGIGVVIAACTVSGNLAGANGGGLYCVSSSPTVPVIENCAFIRNSAAGAGGGLYCHSSGPALTTCTLSGNTAGSYGGGVYCDTAVPVLTDCTIAGNTAGTGGGGVGCVASSAASLVRCRIGGNAAVAGGGLYCSASAPTLTNCTFGGNTASTHGGGVYCNSSVPTLTNCTFGGNVASARGGGVYCNSSAPALVNCIFAGHPQSAVYEVDSSSDPLLTNCQFFGNPNGDYRDHDSASTKTGTQVNGLTPPGTNSGNIVADPRFVMDGVTGVTGTWSAAPAYNPATGRTTLTDASAAFTPGALVGRFIAADSGQLRQALIATNTATAVEVVGDVTAYVALGESYRLVDYRLLTCSGAIDTGTGTGAPATDIEGTVRPFGVAGQGANPPPGSNYDIGAYEAQIANTAPSVVSTHATVAASEGATVVNTGTFSDANPGDNIIVTASIGAVTQLGTQSGTWSWAFIASDGPNQSQTVTVTATDCSGAQSTITFALTVSDVAPTVAVTGADTVSEGTVYTLTLGAVTDPGADTVTGFTVFWGDGTSNTYPGAGAKPHSYAEGPNAYTISVSVTDEDGTHAGAGSKSVTVNNAAPTVTVGTPVTLTEGDALVRSGSFADPGADTWTATVNYGDGSGVQPLGLNLDQTFSLSHLYTDNGIYPVTVTVSDDDGGTRGESFTATVLNTPPLVFVPLDQAAQSGQSFSFYVAAFVDSGPADTHLATVNWGDGTAPAGIVLPLGARSVFASHTYTHSGTYTVAVTVTDDDGGTGSGSFNVAVDVPAVAFLTAVSATTESAGTALLTVQLSIPSGNFVAVDYGVVGGTAIGGGGDYTLLDGTLLFYPGETVQTIAVTVTPDSLPEPEEQVVIRLSNPVNAVLGSVTEHTLTIAEGFQQTPVVQGWNWLAFSVIPADSSLESVLAGCQPQDNDEFKTMGYLGGTATYFGGVWYGLEGGIQPGVMYLLKRQSPGGSQLTVSGTPAATAATIPLAQGWNWIGFTGQSAIPVNTAMGLWSAANATDTDELKSQTETATFYAGQWYGMPGGLKPGIGYKLKVQKANPAALRFQD